MPTLLRTNTNVNSNVLHLVHGTGNSCSTFYDYFNNVLLLVHCTRKSCSTLYDYFKVKY